MMTGLVLSETRERAQRKLEEIAPRMRGAIVAQQLWVDFLSVEEQRLLGGDLQTAYSQFGAVGMWQKLKGCSTAFAVLDLACQFKLLDTEERDRLLDRLGEMPRDADFVIEDAIASGHLVLRDDEERALAWEGELLDTPLLESEPLWGFFVELAKRSKGGIGVDSDCYGTKERGYVRKTANRIRREMGLPTGLTKLIVATKRNETRKGQRIDLAAERIRVFESDGQGEIREWLPGRR